MLQVGQSLVDGCTIAAPHRQQLRELSVARWTAVVLQMHAGYRTLLLTLLSPALPSTTGLIYRERQAGTERSEAVGPHTRIRRRHAQASTVDKRSTRRVIRRRLPANAMELYGLYDITCNFCGNVGRKRPFVLRRSHLASVTLDRCEL